ncbi:succinate dehydrogenase assembly factor 2 [Thiothrix eikelboomii]|uniref:FAD assembly factor SdhE n=1 Tax=Thiothrix eikelboomii TaxID=92487 RepID=A0A1T4WMI7_9GAMM|nr:succinate dehydrogenase assembly factor 2 [Thiothrix eikelboomii]SKA78098.1 Flavinator of succinate dehydrogenase [Thiothrix eikelboomii]
MGILKQNEAQWQERLIRLRWACHRTHNELNKPLLGFLENVYPSLEMGEQFAFERLLSAADHDILQWLKGKQLPNDQGIVTILALIQQAS